MKHEITVEEWDRMLNVDAVRVMTKSDAIFYLADKIRVGSVHPASRSMSLAAARRKLGLDG